MATSEAAPDAGSEATLRQTPLHALHLARGARMAPFAGYAMPIQYETGIVAEHLHTRAKAGLFDVSHMGQAFLEGPDAATRLETLVPADIGALVPGQVRYTQLLDGDGNILDDLMVTRWPTRDDGTERLFLVVNAGNKEADFALLAAKLPDCRLTVLGERALVALQGPAAVRVLAERWPSLSTLPFMHLAVVHTGNGDGDAIYASRSGYTGEDGFEVSLPPDAGLRFAEHLLEHPDVRPVGLGARDSLRLEAGLCLHGHDISTDTDPVSAGLAWSIGARRRADGGFPGAERIRLLLAHGPDRRRVGLRLEGRAVAREGADIQTPDGRPVGQVTSGTHSPSLGGPIAMGYVHRDTARAGTPLHVLVRGKPVPAAVTRMPFVPHRYHRPTA